MADGHFGECKECSKSAKTANRWANIDRSRTYDKEHAKKPEVRARRAVQSKLIRHCSPLCNQVHNLLMKAIKRGEVQRKPCEICGALRVHGHHDDYSKPLSVRWLCAIHHAQVHAEKRRINLEA
jgi:hypothetical protein